MQLTYEKTFSSQRADGRMTSSLAAHMEMMRHAKPLLAMPENLTKETFPVWQKQVVQKTEELLLLPPRTRQPDPVRLSHTQRDG